MTTTHRRLAPLLAQFDFGVESLLDRLKGMVDEEYFWEPVPGCWNVRRRADHPAAHLRGEGEWGFEFEHPAPDPPPFTTIAWRISHLAGGLAARADWTVGSKSMDYDDFNVPGSAAAGIASLQRSAAAWREAMTAATTDAELDQIGRSSFPWGLDPDLPFIEICWWVNKELIHHGAEVALLRDLWRARQ